MQLEVLNPIRRGIVMLSATESPESIRFSDLASSDRKFEFRATQREPDAVLQIRKGAALYGSDMAKFARDAIEAAYERLRNGLPLKGEPQPNADGFATFRAPYLSAVPCGPWQGAVDCAESFTISTEAADELEAQDGDVWIRANGQSMEGAGILDGVLVLVRPYDRKTPRRGDIVLVQVEAQGEIVGTLKRFDGFDGDGMPKLLDGQGEAFELPDGADKPLIIARAIGTLGRL